MPTKLPFQVNAQRLRETCMFGIELREKVTGEYFQDDRVEEALRAAAAQFERELQISITPKRSKPNLDTPWKEVDGEVQIREDPYDYHLSTGRNWFYVQLRHRPVLDVVNVTLKYGQNQFFQFPNEWLKVYHKPGQIQVVPSPLGIGAGIVGSTIFGFRGPLFVGWQTVPGFIEVEYTHGFTEEQIPEDLVKHIYLQAAIDIMNIMGDVFLPPGLAAQSVSIDGLSESISTTASATNALFGARILNYKRQIKEFLAAARRRYRSEAVAFV